MSQECDFSILGIRGGKMIFGGFVRWISSDLKVKSCSLQVASEVQEQVTGRGGVDNCGAGSSVTDIPQDLLTMCPAQGHVGDPEGIPVLFIIDVCILAHTSTFVWVSFVWVSV